jgi:8-oxo-dGTP diphosphatase
VDISPEETFATPRIAAGALFVDGNRVLLVRKTYGNRWDLPGGYVEVGESPGDAVRREVLEEIGIARKPVRLLAVDWAPNDEGDKILWVFHCGDMGDDERTIAVDNVEIDMWEWVPVENLASYVIPRLERRILCAYKAHANGQTTYLEHGVPVLQG